MGVAITVATAGSGSVAACIAIGALKGAAVGAVTGAVSGAATSAVKHRVTTGSWKGSGVAALDGAASGALSGTITGAKIDTVEAEASVTANVVEFETSSRGVNVYSTLKTTVAYAV